MLYYHLDCIITFIVFSPGLYYRICATSYVAIEGGVLGDGNDFCFGNDDTTMDFINSCRAVEHMNSYVEGGVMSSRLPALQRHCFVGCFHPASNCLLGLFF